MRQFAGWSLTAVLVSSGCGGHGPLVGPTPAPTTTPETAAPSPSRPSRDAGNWTPWSFAPWQPGAGVPLALNTNVNAAAYDILVMSCVRARLPFQLTAEIRGE
jgi:hypothetical protein